MKRILVPALAALSLAACLDDDPIAVERTECDPLLTQVTGVSGDTVSAASGLRFIERQAGSGAAASAGKGVEVHYTLSLVDERVIESSCVRAQTLGFVPGVDNIIEGFAQGVVGMRAGGVRRLIVPPSLGYGDIVGHQFREETLVFDIEMVSVVQ